MNITFPTYFGEIIQKKKTGVFELKPSRYKVWYGGRGSAKTESLCLLTLLLLIYSPRMNIVCARESFKVIKDAMRDTYEEVAERFHIAQYFNFKNDEVACVLNKNKIIYIGLFNNFSRLKGLNAIDIFWIDEASTVSEKALRMLKPSIRKDNSELWITFNPENEDDPVYRDFILDPPAEGAYIKKVNYRDNDFFNAVLDLERRNDLAKDPLLYQHIWEGELLQGMEDSYWKADQIKQMEIYEPDLIYDRIVIGVDPATTHKDHSNEYGIVAVGELDGQYYILEDGSGSYTPNTFAQKVNEMFKRHNADWCVVETNAGGDFIKSAILTENAFILVKEVRARQEKALRALPVANLSYQGIIYFNGGNDFRRLKSQMMRMTTRGFTGKDGESPDRLEAMIWAIYSLAGLQDGDTVETVFRRDMFNVLDSVPSEYASVFVGGDMFGYIQYSFDKLSKTINIASASVGKTESLSQFLLATENRLPTDIISNKDGIATFHAIKPYVARIKLTDVDYLSDTILHDKVTATISLFYDKKIQTSQKSDQAIFNELRKYTVESKEQFLLLETICSIIANIWRIEDND